MEDSTYWYGEYVLAVKKLKEINDDLTGIKKTTNDKDSIEFDPNAYEIARKYMNLCYMNYQEALEYESNGVKKTRLTHIGRGGDIGF